MSKRPEQYWTIGATVNARVAQKIADKLPFVLESDVKFEYWYSGGCTHWKCTTRVLGELAARKVWCYIEGCKDGMIWY